MTSQTPYPDHSALLIAGPTAGGKSALALRLAAKFNGVIINTDSMQVYRELQLLTARPGKAEMAVIPHRLYGVMSVAESCSAGRWLALAEAEIKRAWTLGQVPILVGGTGLYFSALLDGLSPIPDVPDALRQELRVAFSAVETPALHQRLADEDPDMAARLRPSDRQRICRALEVLIASGRSLSHWQSLPPSPPLLQQWTGVVVDRPRATLYQRCDDRLAAMLDAGALAEVEKLMTMDLDPALPAMRALGVPELMAHLRGEIDRSQALAAAQQATRRYAKRQLTWLRRNMRAWKWLEAKEMESFCLEIFSKIR